MLPTEVVRRDEGWFWNLSVFTTFGEAISAFPKTQLRGISNPPTAGDTWVLRPGIDVYVRKLFLYGDGFIEMVFF